LKNQRVEGLMKAVNISLKDRRGPVGKGHGWGKKNRGYGA